MLTKWWFKSWPLTYSPCSVRVRQSYILEGAIQKRNFLTTFYYLRKFCWKFFHKTNPVFPGWIRIIVFVSLIHIHRSLQICISMVLEQELQSNILIVSSFNLNWMNTNNRPCVEVGNLKRGTSNFYRLFWSWWQNLLVYSVIVLFVGRIKIF